MSSSKPSNGSFEFTAEQNQVIQQLAAAMQWVAFPLLFLGVLYLLTAIGVAAMVFQDWRHLPSLLVIVSAGLIWVFLGRWITRSADAFNKVVDSQGGDIGHLMTALGYLRNLFSLLSLFVKLYLVLVLAALIMVVVAYFMGAPIRVGVSSNPGPVATSAR